MSNPEWMSDTTILKTLGQKVRSWRLKADMSQAILADAAQVAVSTVAALESGKNISMIGLVRILRMLGKLDALTPFLEDEPPSPIEYEKIMEGKKMRKRASKNTRHDKHAQGIPVWNADGDAPSWE
jgi:transcriptional regulator with XRE-family HTH domain